MAADELRPIIHNLLVESINYDPSIHSKLCRDGKLDGPDMTKLFPNLTGFDFFKNRIKTTKVYKELEFKKPIVDAVFNETFIKKQIHEKINKYCAKCEFNCGTQAPMPIQQAMPLLQQPPLSVTTPFLQPRPLSEPTPLSVPTPLQPRPLSDPMPSSVPTPQSTPSLNSYRSKLPNMEDDNVWTAYVRNMRKTRGNDWFKRIQEFQTQKPKNLFARGGGVCEDEKKRELINCIANSLVASISKKISGGTRRIRRVRQSYKKTQRRRRIKKHKLRNKKNNN